MFTRVLGGMLVATMGMAHAEEPERPRGAGYRMDLVVADVASIGVMTGAALSIRLDRDGDRWMQAASVIGAGGYVFAAPLIHASRGNFGRSALSFGLRVLSPVAIGLGMASLVGPEPYRDVVAFTGITIGAGIASAIDTWVIVPDAPARAPTEPFAAPMVTPVAGGAVGGISGLW